MRLSNLLVSAPLLLALLPFSGLRAQDTAEEQVARAVREHWTAINRGDADAVAAQHTADISMFLSEAGPRLHLHGSGGADDLMSRWRGSRPDWHPRDIEVRMLGRDAAVATLYLDGSITWADGTVTSGPRRVTEIWTRTADGWKEAHHHDDPVPPEDARATIERRSEAMFQSLLDGRVARELWAEDPVLYPPDEPAVSGEAALDYLGGISDQVDFLEITDHEREIEVLGPVAYEMGSYTARVAVSGGTEQTVYPRYVVVWRRDPDGTWRVARDIWNFGSR